MVIKNCLRRVVEQRNYSWTAVPIASVMRRLQLVLASLHGFVCAPTKKTVWRLSVVLVVLAMCFQGGYRRQRMSDDALNFLKYHADQLDPFELDSNATLFEFVSEAPVAPGILFSNQYALHLTLNWMCNIAAFNLTERIVVIALDDITANTLTTVWPQVTVFHWNIPSMGDRFSIGTGPYQMFQVLRAKVVSYLTKTGSDFWMLQADTFWGRNLFTEFDVNTIEGDVIFDQEGKDGLAHRMIAGGNFYVRANQRAAAFFDEVAKSLKSIYATDNNLMGKFCFLRLHGVNCGEIPFDLVANWRWHLGPRTEVPPLLQFDELGAGKFERMAGLKLKFANDEGICLPNSRNPRLDLADLLKYPLPKTSSYHMLMISHAFFELLMYLYPASEPFIRCDLLPSCAYFIVL